MERYRSAAILLEPALYRICNLGYLDANWSEYCGNMAIEHANDPKFHAITIVTDRSMDQTALIGVLNALHDLGCPMMSVEYLATE
jgi:hypothetical protein